jgi:hypothetical protein
MANNYKIKPSYIKKINKQVVYKNSKEKENPIQNLQNLKYVIIYLINNLHYLIYSLNYLMLIQSYLI